MVNGMGLMAAQRGHEPPSESFYELRSKRFFMDNDDFQSLRSRRAALGSAGAAAESLGQVAVPAAKPEKFGAGASPHGSV